MHLFFTKEGPLSLTGSLLKFTRKVCDKVFSFRFAFLFLLFMTSILTLTTSPISITDGMEDSVESIKTIESLPVHELGLNDVDFSSFHPNLMDETDKIMKAQMARGSDMSTGSMKERMDAVVPLLVPLFVSAFKRAEDLATAMEVRGYREAKEERDIESWNGFVRTLH